MFGRTRKDKARTLIASICNGSQAKALELLTDDFEFVDSMGVRCEGKDAFALLLERFNQLKLGFEIEFDGLGVDGDDLLMTGTQTSSDPRFDAKVQWKITFRGSKISRLRTYRNSEPPSIVRMLRNDITDFP